MTCVDVLKVTVRAPIEHSFNWKDIGTIMVPARDFKQSECTEQMNTAVKSRTSTRLARTCSHDELLPFSHQVACWIKMKSLSKGRQDVTNQQKKREFLSCRVLVIKQLPWYYLECICVFIRYTISNVKNSSVKNSLP